MTQAYLHLRGSPFLTIAVVSTEVLRAQEEWEAVDNIQPETGNGKNGTISIQLAVSKGTVHLCGYGFYDSGIRRQNS